MEPIEETVLEILAAKAAALESESDLALDTPIEEAGIDSLSMIEIIFELEEAFDIAIPDPTTVEERVQTFKTPREVVAMVRSLIEERDAAK